MRTQSDTLPNLVPNLQSQIKILNLLHHLLFSQTCLIPHIHRFSQTVLHPSGPLLHQFFFPQTHACMFPGEQLVLFLRVVFKSRKFCSVLFETPNSAAIFVQKVPILRQNIFFTAYLDFCELYVLPLCPIRMAVVRFGYRIVISTFITMKMNHIHTRKLTIGDYL